MSGVNYAASAAGATIDLTHSAYISHMNDANAIDSNRLTFANAYTTQNDQWFTCTVTFAQTITLTGYYIKWMPNTDELIYSFDYYNGAWVTLITAEEPAPWSIEKVLSDNFTEDEVIGNVSKVRFSVTNIDGGGYTVATWVYEIEAYAEAYADKGFRLFDGVSNLSLACESLDGHKVRIRGSDGVIYGVPLVGTVHPQASPFRIYDGTAVKAFVDITP